MTETQGLSVDVESLRAEVRDKYRAVAVAPDASTTSTPADPSPPNSATTAKSWMRCPTWPSSPSLESPTRCRSEHSNPANASWTSVRAPGSTRSSPRTPSPRPALSSVST